jgi:hypothetical protein
VGDIAGHSPKRYVRGTSLITCGPDGRFR